MTRSTARLTAGIVIGTLLTATIAVAGRRLERAPAATSSTGRPSARLRVAASARRRLAAAERARAEDFYRGAAERVAPLVASEIGVSTAITMQPPAIMDRLQWIDLNLDTFQRLIGRLEVELTGSRPTPAAPARVGPHRQSQHRQPSARLAARVPRDQGAGAVRHQPAGHRFSARGRLYFVEANIVATADTLGIERNAFRTFIAIHEVTHAYEFEAHPWLRPTSRRWSRTRSTSSRPMPVGCGPAWPRPATGPATGWSGS